MMSVLRMGDTASGRNLQIEAATWCWIKAGELIRPFSGRLTDPAGNYLNNTVKLDKVEQLIIPTGIKKLLIF